MLWIPGEPLDGLIQHQQRDHETGELAGGHQAGFDLQARVIKQADDGRGAEEFDEWGGDGLAAAT
jgi:hypothetical protein